MKEWLLVASSTSEVDFEEAVVAACAGPRGGTPEVEGADDK